MFSRTFSFTTAQQAEALKNQLLGEHVMIHNVDFEIMEEEDNTISIIAHTEQIEEVKTLPDTVVAIQEANGQTKVKISCNIREFDKGAPMLAMIFNVLVYIAAAVLFFIFKFILASCIVLAVGIIFTIAFVVRMQTGYYDYVHKVVNYVKQKAIA
jgi:hypothetical protein